MVSGFGVWGLGDCSLPKRSDPKASSRYAKAEEMRQD